MRVGRNETCPCGSGKKYKNCCATKAAPKNGMLLLLAAIAAVAAIGIVPAVIGRDDKKASTPLPAASGTPRPADRPGSPQPPGPAPAGKVWSVEHGHWHDASPSPSSSPIQVSPIQTSGGTLTPQVTPAAAPQPTTPVPQPPGAVPPGKVWSPEHGHWHDLPKQ